MERARHTGCQGRGLENRQRQETPLQAESLRKGSGFPSSSALVSQVLYSLYSSTAKVSNRSCLFLPDVFTEQVTEVNSMGQDEVNESQVAGQVTTKRVWKLLRHNQFGKDQN